MTVQQQECTVKFYAVPFRNVHYLLIDACDIPVWDRSAQSWRSNDGQWYSLGTAELKALQGTFENLIKLSKLGIDNQWIIASEGLDFLKNILSNPEPYPKHIEITSRTWDLIFNLLSENSDNQSKIWNECNELLLHYLQQDFHNKDTCRLVVYNMYARAREGFHEGTRILKSLLKSFHREKQSGPLKEQGLTMFLEHFITEEKHISAMYLQLTSCEIISLLQFTVDHLGRKEVNGLKDSVSVDLMCRVRDDFHSKSEHTFNASITDDVHLQQLFSLFEVIATCSHEPSYELNRFDYDLVRNVGHLLTYVQSNKEKAERIFSSVQRNSSHQPLKIIILTTISNLVKDNRDHKERVRIANG